MIGCSEEWEDRISATFDGEDSASERSRSEAHLDSCGACRQLFEGYGGLRVALREEAESSAVEVPTGLRRRIESLVDAAASQKAERQLRRSSFFRRASAAAAALTLASGLLWAGWPRGLNEALAMDLERHHLKAFSRAQPCEFESSDPEAVKAWAKAEVGYDVHVPQVPGAVLLGARRCKLGGKLSVSLLYRHGNQAITLFAPAQDSPATKHSRRFVDAGARCTQGPMGERICVSVRGDSATIAVSELGDAQLLGALGEVHP